MSNSNGGIGEMSVVLDLLFEIFVIVVGPILSVLARCVALVASCA